jgi:hypothetical protein
MPERQRGRDPKRSQKQESPKAPFHRAARYPDELSSEPPYNQAQQLIHDESCELSAYRLRIAPEYRWHVAVLGNPRPTELVRRIEEILVTREQVTLPEDG